MHNPHVMFVCDSNSGRSIAAEFIARKYFKGVQFSSAGTQLKYPRPKADCIAALQEFAGVDASVAECKLWTHIPLPVDAIVILCCERDGSCKRLTPAPPPETRVLHLPLQGLSELSAKESVLDVNRSFIQLIDTAVRVHLPRLLPDLLPVQHVSVV